MTTTKPPVGAHVRITETFPDGTKITAEGRVTHHEPGVDFVYIGSPRYTMCWRVGQSRRPEHVNSPERVDVEYLDEVTT